MAKPNLLIKQIKRISNSKKKIDLARKRKQKTKVEKMTK